MELVQPEPLILPITSGPAEQVPLNVVDRRFNPDREPCRHGTVGTRGGVADIAGGTAVSMDTPVGQCGFSPGGGIVAMAVWVAISPLVVGDAGGIAVSGTGVLVGSVALTLDSCGESHASAISNMLMHNILIANTLRRLHEDSSFAKMRVASSPITVYLRTRPRCENSDDYSSPIPPIGH